MTDVHGLQSFVSTRSEESESLPFILCLKKQMLLTSAFPKENSVPFLEEWVLVFKVFTTATRKLRVQHPTSNNRDKTQEMEITTPFFTKCGFYIQPSERKKKKKKSPVSSSRRR